MLSPAIVSVLSVSYCGADGGKGKTNFFMGVKKVMSTTSVEPYKTVSYNGFVLEVHKGDHVAFQARVSKLGNLKLWDSGELPNSHTLIQASKEASGAHTVEPVDAPRNIAYADCC